ncbi:hypothetical protein [Vibrio sp. YIC-376]|uniref:hypothetical protein n=1 Tax=Vibrio sp. YIC-376 TaxID=3136162 RepID=UPI00402A826F
MSVQRKHTDLPPRYEAADFTTEQRHRFTAVANAAQKRRDFYKSALEKVRLEKLRQQDCKPMVTPQQDKLSRTSQVLWLLVMLVIGLWLMYMFA